jgi:hypothetical protein
MVTKFNESPIRTAFNKNENIPKAIYRQYPDQLMKEIEDIRTLIYNSADNFKLFI